MTQQEFTAKATEIIRQTVDALADKEYEKLASFLRLAPSWIEEGQTLQEAFVEFGEWLDGQLAMWEEEEEKPFQIDHFEESCIEDMEDFSENQTSAMVTYLPTNAGERLDLWFEIAFSIENDGELTAELNVNV